MEVANEMYLPRHSIFWPIDLYKSDSKRFKIIARRYIITNIIHSGSWNHSRAKSIEEERKKKRFSSIEDLRERTTK